MYLAKLWSPIVMNRKLKQWWAAISPISTKRIITSHVNFIVAMTQLKKNHDKAVCGLEYSLNKTTNKCYHKCRQEKQLCDVHGDCYVNSKGKPRCV